MRLTSRAAVIVSTLVVGLTTLGTRAAEITPRQVIDDILASDRPTADIVRVSPAQRLTANEFPLPDLNVLRAEDVERDQLDLPARFAVAEPVVITPDTDGLWETPRDGLNVWRLRITSPGALSINLGFGKFNLPKEARLVIYATDGSQQIRPLTARDNSESGQFWTPVLTTDDIVVELTITDEALSDLSLELTSVNPGYRFFGEAADNSRSGSCNVDVVCSQGDDWRNEIPAIGAYTISGVETCSGSLINNTSYDKTPYFLTADHCSVSTSNDQNVVIYWNYENSTCRPPGSGSSGGSGNGSLSEFTSGTIFRADYSTSDMTLLELSSAPDPAWNLSWAGWDATGANATSAVGIHHPQVEEKRISFENDPTSTTTYLETATPGNGTHVRIEDWDVGTTEPGSSGSPLFNQDHRIIGQLHGGFAACGNDDSDWYGKFSVSFPGGGSAATSLVNWLDPGNTGALVLDTLSGLGMVVTPLNNVLHIGNEGGPFTNPSTVYTLTNPTADPINYEVSLSSSFGILLNGGTSSLSGTLPALGGSTNVTVSLGPDIDSLAAGIYAADVLFDDITNSKSVSATHTVEIGQTLIAVTPQNDFFTGGPTGGPFPATMDYTITSERPTPVDVQVTADVAWLQLNGGAGPVTLNLVGTGDNDVVTVSIAPSANSLAAGVYHGSVTITNLTGGGGSTVRDVTLEVGSLLYSAADVPQAITDNNTIVSSFTVTEDFCMLDVDVSVDITHTYIGDLTVDLVAPGGTTVRLHDRSGGSTEDIVTTYGDVGGSAPDGPGSLSDFAGLNSAGLWQLVVTDNAGGDVGTLNAWSLHIVVTDGDCPTPEVVYSFPLDTDPGWATVGQWAFGEPAGLGGDHGDPDPTSGHTGSKVYGYNLNGGYANSLASTQYLTTTPIDCTDITGTRLVFWRWLGVEKSTYDHANIQVSSGGGWTTVWANGTSDVDDGEWVQVTYDISAVADGSDNVRIRWGMGTTDSSFTFCGWNIDDVEIWGILPAAQNPGWDECMTGPEAGPAPAGCESYDYDSDDDVDLADFAEHQHYAGN